MELSHTMYQWPIATYKLLQISVALFFIKKKKRPKHLIYYFLQFFGLTRWFFCYLDLHHLVAAFCLGSAGRPKMADGTSCQLGHFRSSRGSFSSVDSMIGFLTWESQGCPPAGKRKKSQGLLGSRYLNSLITSATSSQSHSPAHIQSSRKIDISRWVKQKRHVIKMLAFWK